MENENNNIHTDTQSAREREEQRLASLYGPPELRESLKEENAEEIVMESAQEEDPKEAPVEIPQLEPEVEKIQKSYATGIPIDEETDTDVWFALADALKIIFSPILIPVYVTILVFQLSMFSAVSGTIKLVFTLVAFAFCTLAPIVIIMLLKRYGYIKDMMLSERRERTLPYSLMFFALGGTALFFAFKGATNWFWMLYIGGATSALVNMIINFKWKICSHATALGALVAAMLIIQTKGMPQVEIMWWEIGAVLAAGIVGSSCIATRGSNLWQVLVGYATGFIPVILFEI